MSIPEPNPSGYCMCGCGNHAPIATQTDTKRGQVKDRPKRFVSGHDARSINAKVEIFCQQCGKGFFRGRTRIGPFCSKGCSGVALRKPVEIGFWNRVAKPADSDACWGWLGPVTEFGYGHFQSVGKNISAHRFSYKLHYGSIPKGLSVLHRCDNPPCTNPEHLFLGTQADNIHDMIRKGRNNPSKLCGEQHPHAKLSDTSVIEIRHLHETGISATELAQKFGISTDNIRLIVRRLAWKHIE